MATPTIDEVPLVDEFRNRVKDILETDEQKKTSFLLRWLRARDLDMTKAENMLRTSLAWRRENKVDSILELPVDKYIETEFPLYILGVDKKGQPIVVLPVGKWDFRKCAAQGKTEEFKHYINHTFERICGSIEKQNKTRDPDLHPITQCTVIMDWKGYTYMQLCSLKAVQNMLYTGVTYEAHYPEILSSCIFINCPSFFNLVMVLIKQILAAKTYEKISVYGSNREEWESACKNIINDDQLVEILKLLS